MLPRFNRSRCLPLDAVRVLVIGIPSDTLATWRGLYAPEWGRGVMALAQYLDVDADIVAMAVRGYGYKGYTLDGGKLAPSAHLVRRLGLRKRKVVRYG